MGHTFSRNLRKSPADWAQEAQRIKQAGEARRTEEAAKAQKDTTHEAVDALLEKKDESQKKGD